MVKYLPKTTCCIPFETNIVLYIILASQPGGLENSKQVSKCSNVKDRSQPGGEYDERSSSFELNYS